MTGNLNLPEKFDGFKGEIEIEVRDRCGRIIRRHREHNLIKIFAKEMLAYRLPYSKVWDPTGGSGHGAWVSSQIDELEEFAAKYILIGASFDTTTGLPGGTGTDARYYTTDPVTGTPVAKTPNVGADNFGDLINPVPISEPSRPLKRIEKIYFEPSYQPPESPLISDGVRALNNVLVLETTLRQEEYNGFGMTSGDFFTITEIGLAGGTALDTSVGACDCVPKLLFLQGVEARNDIQIAAIANASQTITIDSGVSADDMNRIKEGDQIMIVGQHGGSEDTYDTIGQLNPYYLVISKSGRSVVLDRTPVNATTSLQGPIGIYRSTLRMFSQRILSIPFKKSSDFSITLRWRISFA